MNQEPKTETGRARPGQRERQEKLATGQITIAEALGLSKPQLYAIARRGHQLLVSGRVEEARRIYAGLVAADPFDSVFHCHLGACLQRLGEAERAFDEYDAALRFNVANVDALAGRGELYLAKGELRRGIEDLSRSVELDPEGARPASVRARALLLALRRQSAAAKKSAPRARS
jgi:tetratricopeptide (TPR) repeat protein